MRCGLFVIAICTAISPFSIQGLESFRPNAEERYWQGKVLAEITVGSYAAPEVRNRPPLSACLYLAISLLQNLCRYLHKYLYEHLISILKCLETFLWGKKNEVHALSLLQ